MYKFVYYADNSMWSKENNDWWWKHYPSERDHRGLEKNNICLWSREQRIPLKTFYRDVPDYAGLGRCALLIGRVRTAEHLMMIRLNFGYPVWEDSNVQHSAP